MEQRDRVAHHLNEAYDNIGSAAAAAGTLGAWKDAFEACRVLMVMAAASVPRRPATTKAVPKAKRKGGA